MFEELTLQDFDDRLNQRLATELEELRLQDEVTRRARGPRKVAILAPQSGPRRPFLAPRVAVFGLALWPFCLWPLAFRLPFSEVQSH